MKKSELLEKLKGEITSEEWMQLRMREVKTISEFNLYTLFEMRKTLVEEDVDIPQDKIDGLHNILKGFLEEYMKEQPEGWKWVLISCLYLTFIAEKPMHPMELLDIEEKEVDGRVEYLCPSKSSEDTESTCYYCVCLPGKK